MSEHGIWTARAQEALERALSEVRDGEDALPSVSLADACLRADQGVMGADELADLTYFFYERPAPQCICPPDLIARGGFRGGCPACAPALASSR
jgi:hypothetical protein